MTVGTKSTGVLPRFILWAAILALLSSWTGCAAEGSIGARLGKSHTTGRVLVHEVPRDMNAWKDGLRPGDELLSIDGRDVRSMTAREIHEALVGPEGTTVALTVLRDGKVVRLRVKRGRLK